jgi:hypothetical protein
MAAKPKIVYLLVEVGDNTYWNRAGVAFENQDGSFNMKLDLFPNVTFNIRDPKENGDREPEEKKGKR